MTSPGTQRVVEFDDLYADTFDWIRSTVALATGDPDGAADATQEAFALVLRRWRRVRAMERPASYVTVCAMNIARRRLRRDSRRPDPQWESAPSELSLTVVEAVDLRDALTRLAPRQRMAIVLRYLGDLPIKDIAKSMGCSQGTVKATLSQALQRMRQDLDRTRCGPGAAAEQDATAQVITP